jgi:hypothetical protein
MSIPQTAALQYELTFDPPGLRLIAVETTAWPGGETGTRRVAVQLDVEAMTTVAGRLLALAELLANDDADELLARAIDAGQRLVDDLLAPR